MEEYGKNMKNMEENFFMIFKKYTEYSTTII